MFQTPIRALATLRLRVPPVIFAASAVSTLVFIATPFLITGLSEQGNINVNRVGLISSTQLLGFVIGSWGSGRFIGPLIGGTMFAVSPQLLGLVGAAIMIMAAVTFIGLERRQEPLLAA